MASDKCYHVEFDEVEKYEKMGFERKQKIEKMKKTCSHVYVYVPSPTYTTQVLIKCL